jgi:hypothetical protein
MSRLNSTRPDRKSNPKKFEEWYVRYCPVMDDTTRRFVELFRKKILVAMTLHEIVLPPEYWVTTLASLTITAGKVEGLLLDDPDKHLANCRVVLYKEDWEKWKAKGRSKRDALEAAFNADGPVNEEPQPDPEPPSETPAKKPLYLRREEWEERERNLMSGRVPEHPKVTNYRQAAEIIAKEEGVSWQYIEREIRTVRTARR